MLCTDETRLETFGHYAQSQIKNNPNISAQITHVKNGDRGVMTFTYFAATGPEYLAVGELNIILESRHKFL